MKLPPWINRWHSSCLDMIYPQYCRCCSALIGRVSSILCYSCLSALKRTDNHLFAVNPIRDLFLGAVEIHSASSFYYFRKGGVLQRLLHQLKYNNMRDVGPWLGIQMATGLRDWASMIDVVIPIPLHPHKKNKRGYNQSQLIAEGFAGHLGIYASSTILLKIVNNESQTRKNKQERIKNVQNVFKIKNSRRIRGKHVLLLDDVITTGSTLISAIEELEKNGQPEKISVLVLASQPFL